MRDNLDVYQYNKDMLLYERRFRDIFQHMPIPLALNDSNGNITALNDQFTRVFGYDRIDIPTLNHW